VIFLHDNAIAAGWVLAQIAASVGRRFRIVYGGTIGRAENRAMLKLLGVPLHCLDSRKGAMRFLAGDRYALVDTQPGVGNNAFPHNRLECHIVIDHHPKRLTCRVRVIDIRDEVGCCTTMLLEHYRALGLVPDANLATAAAYAIISETQDLGREATREDQEALQFLLPYVRLTVLGRIRHPARTREYYRTIAHAMQRVMVSRNSCVCHIGPVESPELVAEIADFLIAMERVSWCLVTGLHNRTIALSIRTKHRRAKADRVMKRIVKNLGTGGGHGMTAGGAIPCGGIDAYAEYTALATRRFVNQLHRRHPDSFRPLLEQDTATRGPSAAHP
jgi:nanoRNase/pAp phosphatase (c-di-AMP/oligoRNAs hydrolase)